MVKDVKMRGHEDVHEALRDCSCTKNGDFLIDRIEGGRLNKEPMTRKGIIRVTSTLSPILSSTAFVFQDSRLIPEIINELHIWQIFSDGFEEIDKSWSHSTPSSRYLMILNMKSSCDMLPLR